jgi:hypothetical protein
LSSSTGGCARGRLRSSSCYCPCNARLGASAAVRVCRWGAADDSRARSCRSC